MRQCGMPGAPISDRAESCGHLQSSMWASGVNPFLLVMVSPGPRLERRLDPATSRESLEDALRYDPVTLLGIVCVPVWTCK